MGMYVYIDTYGNSRDITREAPSGARLAAHTERGAVELLVSPDGHWTVIEGPPTNAAGEHRPVARGRHGEPPSCTHYPDAVKRAGGPSSDTNPTLETD